MASETRLCWAPGCHCRFCRSPARCEGEQTHTSTRLNPRGTERRACLPSQLSSRNDCQSTNPETKYCTSTATFQDFGKLPWINLLGFFTEARHPLRHAWEMCNTQFFFFTSWISKRDWAFFWQKLQTYLSSATCHAIMSLFVSSQASRKIYRCLGLFPSCKTSLYKQEKVNARKLTCLFTKETWLKLFPLPSIRHGPNVLAL